MQDEMIAITEKDFSYASITEMDIHFAEKLWPVLLDCAMERSKQGWQSLTYAEFKNIVKGKYPDDPVIQGLIDVTVGRRLELIGIFCRKKGLPNITALLVNKASGKSGALASIIDDAKERERIAALDWSAITTEFTAIVGQTRKSIRPLQRRKREEALELMAGYNKANREVLKPYDKFLRSHREHIIEQLQQGLEVEDVFESLVREHDPVSRF